MKTANPVAASLYEARRWCGWKASATRLTEARLQLVGRDHSLLAVARARR